MRMSVVRQSMADLANVKYGVIWGNLGDWLHHSVAHSGQFVFAIRERDLVFLRGVSGR